MYNQSFDDVYSFKISKSKEKKIISGIKKVQSEYIVIELDRHFILCNNLQNSYGLLKELTGSSYTLHCLQHITCSSNTQFDRSSCDQNKVQEVSFENDYVWNTVIVSIIYFIF